MKFADIVFLLMILTFLPFNEGIIAKSPRWKKLADLIELGLRKAFTWRANANIISELDMLALYFKHASIVTGLIVFLSILLKSKPLMLWTSIIFFFCFFASFSFKWTFKHVEAIRPFAPMVGFCLFAPWALLVLDYLVPNAGLMYMFAQQLSFLPIHPSTSFEVAIKLFLLFVALFGSYYIFGWMVFSPFAYFILAGLKISRSLSGFLIRRFNRNLLNDISIFIQFFGLVYLYCISRQR